MPPDEVVTDLIKCPLCHSADLDYDPEPDEWDCNACGSTFTRQGVEALNHAESEEASPFPLQPWDVM